LIERYSREEVKRIFSEESRIRRWIEVELALLKALGELGLVPGEAHDEVSRRLKDLDLEALIRRSRELEEEIKHDFLAFLTALEEVSGPYGRYLHYGATSSDIIDTANALMLRDAATLLLDSLKKLLFQLLELSRKYIDFPIMGRTHGVFAEPTSLGLKFLGYASEAHRNARRMEIARDQISYGKMSGAVGNYAFLNLEVEKRALEILGLRREPVSTQVVPRDRYAEFLSAIALSGAFLERLALEIRLLHRTEVGEVMEPFSRGQRGSSAMPHKRNPIRCERITGMARLLRGYMLSAFENIALWHERDISHSSVERIVLPDSVSLLYYMSELMGEILRDLDVDENRIRENLRKYGDFYLSEALLLALVRKGASRKEAYRWVKECSFESQKRGVSFASAAKAHPSVLSYLDPDEIDKALSHDYLKNARQVLSEFEKLLESEGLLSP